MRMCFKLKPCLFPEGFLCVLVNGSVNAHFSSSNMLIFKAINIYYENHCIL